MAENDRTEHDMTQLDEVSAAVAVRHKQIDEAFGRLDRAELLEESRLPGWSRLTIACHLRYGADASYRITEEALHGRPVAFYPTGRDRQRPTTLQPAGGESDADVVASLAEASRRLDVLWSKLGADQWNVLAEEPPDHRDLGPITLKHLSILRLTEVEVHGFDLDLDLPPWSPTFVATALPMRLRWLPARPSNHQPSDQTIDGTWELISTDGPTFVVRARGKHVEVEENATAPDADAQIRCSARELLAFILGRATLSDHQVRGDRQFARGFLSAFPAP